MATKHKQGRSGAIFAKSYEERPMKRIFGRQRLRSELWYERPEQLLIRIIFLMILNFGSKRFKTTNYSTRQFEEKTR